MFSDQLFSNMNIRQNEIITFQVTPTKSSL